MLFCICLCKQNGEFQWYTDSDRNSFVRDGHLVIKPTLTTELRMYPDLEACGGIAIQKYGTYTIYRIRFFFTSCSFQIDE